MLKSIKNNAYWPNIILMGYMIINIILIVQTMQIPEMSGKIPWLAMVWTIGLAIYVWYINTGLLPKNGLVVLGVISLGICITYILLVLFPSDGFITRLSKIGLVVFSGLILVPISYLVGKTRNTPEELINKESSPNSSVTYSLSNLQLIILWCGIGLFLLGYFIVPVFLRDDVLGYDTPTYILRTRLLDKFGITTHAQIEGGYHIGFPWLSAFVHNLTGLDYLDIVRLLPPLMMLLVCLATGYFAYEVFRSHTYAILTTIFTAAWGLSAHLIVDARDNLTVMLFGSLGMIILGKTGRPKAWFYEILLMIFLILTGVSHLSLSIIFLITTFHVYLIDFIELYWMGERKDLLKHLWRVIRIPLISGLIIAVIWSPVIMDFINSLGFGLRTHAELGEGRDTSFSWIIKRYNFTMNLPWIFLGYIFVIWNLLTKEHSRNLRVLYAWTTICVVFGIVLQPLSFLNSRYFAMIPTFFLIPLGFYFLWKYVHIITRYSNMPLVVVTLIAVLGFISTSTLAMNAKLLINIPGLPVKYYQNMDYINHFIESYKPSTPYVFLVEDTGPFSETYSDLWRRIIRSRIDDSGLLNTYIYFGTLDFFLKGKQTPLEQNGLPELQNETAFSNSSQRWFDILIEDRVFEQTQMTVFILAEYNPVIYSDYEYLPVVDKIGPGVLVINVPDDLKYQNSLMGNTP